MRRQVRQPGSALVARARKRDAGLFPDVREALAALVPRKLRSRITPDASILADLGLDSLKVVELTMLLEKQLRRPVFLPEWIASVEDPADLTVGSLARFLADRK
jgi:acyl carrier protein